MRTLGFSVGHDKGAVIIEDGKVVIGITEERLSRIKNEGAYQGGKIPFKSIRYCLESLELTYKDIDFFVYSTTEIVDDVVERFQEEAKGVSKNSIIFIPHHLAHAYSTFFSSGFDEAAVVVADASGSILSFKNKLNHWYPDINKDGLESEEDWAEGISIYYLTKKDWKEVYKKWIKYPVPINTGEDVSVGTMYSMGSLQLIYEPKSHTWPAGKLMGLASYADEKIVKDAGDFIIEKDNDVFIPNDHIYPRVTWASDFFSRACVAGMYQKEQERVSIMLAKMAKNLTDSKNICVAGGSFLNCNSNEKILKSKIFEKSYFIPCSDDSGIPLGCAWYGYQTLTDIKETEMLSPYLGKSYDRVDVLLSLSEFNGLKYTEYKNFDDVLDVITYWLTQNRVIGWFQGGSEIGPRALGNRSILASPINSWMVGHINNDIKGREWYRPFAPAVMYEHQSKIFESSEFSPYMLLTTTVNKNWRPKIPAVTHIDNTSRHQSVTKDSNPKFYKLIESFYKKTKVPVLLNTSFNGPGEPIVESPYDAIKCFVERNLNFLVIENFIISRS